MGESTINRVIRVAAEEIVGNMAILALMLLAVILAFILLPIAQILKGPALWIVGGALWIMEGAAISGWILAMVITAYPVLLIGLLVLLAISVLLIRKYVKRITCRRSCQ